MIKILENVVPFSRSIGEEVYSLLLEALENGEGEGFGLTVDKVMNRGSIVGEAEGHPGEYVVSVERHRGIAGCVYRKGSPMAAFETYKQLLRFDPKAMALTDFGEEVIGRKINVDQLAVDQLDYDYYPRVSRKLSWKLKRRIEFPILCWAIETHSYEKAKEAVEKEFRSLNYESQFECLDLSNDEALAYSQRTEEVWVSTILIELKRAWENPDLIDD